MRRHASPEELASLDLGGLKPRKAQKIHAHLISCVQCTETNRQLTVVQTTLASVSYPAMPEQFSARIVTVLATESAHRVASAPASEAGRRDLPEPSRRPRSSRRGRRLPGMSVLATRLAAAAGALVIVGVGGYEIASHAGGNVAGTTASSNGSVASPAAPADRMSFGPSVRYGEPSSIKDIRTVTSNTNFTSANLRSQALAAVQTERLPQGNAQASGRPAPSAGLNSGAKSAPGAATATPSTAQLASCLDGLVGSRTVLLVERAKYEGLPATIIVTAASGNRAAEVWAVGLSCTAAHPDVLAHQSLART